MSLGREGREVGRDRLPHPAAVFGHVHVLRGVVHTIRIVGRHRDRGDALSAEVLARDFEVVSVCCKTGGVDKADLGLEQIRPDADLEVSCNPVAQARLMNDAGTDLNVVCGLCVGHDAIFGRLSEAPVTTLVAKDRVLAHNPLGAVYCQYVRRDLLPPE